MPWGDDEKKGMIWIRLFCWGLSIGFVITMYMFGKHTALYHLSIGQDFDLSIPIIHIGLNLFLLSSCLLFTFCESYHRKNNDGQAFDPVVSRRLKYLVLGLVFATLFTAISNIFIQTTLTQFIFWFKKHLSNFRKIVEIVMAIFTISKSDQLKSYISKLMTDIYDQAFFLNIYLVPLFLFVLIHGCIYMVCFVFEI